MAKKKEIHFSLYKFEIGNFSNTIPKEKVRKDRLNFQIQHIFDVDSKNMLFKVGFKVNILAGQQRPIEIATIETETVYKLKGVESESMNRLPDHLIVTFLSIAYSNTRGALAAKAQGTVAGDIPLPLINPTQVIEDLKNQSEPIE